MAAADATLLLVARAGPARGIIAPAMAGAMGVVVRYPAAPGSALPARTAPAPAGRPPAPAALGTRLAMEPHDRQEDQRRRAADLALMQAIAGGDRTAFAALMAGEAPPLLRFASGMLGNLAEAEEVVQETFLRCWRLAADWRPDARLATWLHRVAYNLCVDRIRRQRPSVAIEDVSDVLGDGADPADERMIAADEAERLRQALELLPDRQRTALLLRHFQDLPQAEAAAVMGIGEHAYESLIARARRRLRALLAGADGPEEEDHER
jgi:RNA polymerase sigma-70 factor (ECF subfamily)